MTYSPLQPLIKLVPVERVGQQLAPVDNTPDIRAGWIEQFFRANNFSRSKSRV